MFSHFFRLDVALWFLLLLCIPAITFTAYVWIRRRSYTKERFAFAALNAYLALTLAYFAAATQQSMPWALVSGAILAASGQKFHVPAPGLAEQLLLFLSWIGSLWFISRLFHRWDGLRSERQYRSEQRRDNMLLLIEGLREAKRIIRRDAPLPVHQPEPHVPQIQFPPPFFVPWRRRARDLLRLKWNRYIFDNDTWDEDHACWVGSNTDTEARVLLRCSTHEPHELDMRTLREYAENLRPDGKPETEIIVAIEKPNHAAAISKVNQPYPRLQTEETLLEKLVDWNDYREDIRTRMTGACLPDSELTIADVFVQPRFEPIHWDMDGPTELEKHLIDWLDESGRRQLALLGDYGQGKSTAALAFTHRILNSDGIERIPILVELRGTSPRNSTPQQLLGAWSTNYGINPRALWYLHLAGRLLFIFEGFDEMALVGDTEARLKHFRTLWGFCHERSKILITGRPNFFFDEIEMTIALGVGEPAHDQPYCRPMRLKAFDHEQIASALRSHDEVTRREICEFAKRNTQFLELVSRPALLHVVSVLWNRENLSQKLEQLTSAYVMKLFVDHSYRRQGQKEEDLAKSPEFMQLTTNERKYFMKGVATYMAARQLPNQIDGSQLNDAIACLVEAIPDSVSTGTPEIAGQTRTPLRKRIADVEHGLELVQTDVRTCGILVDDPATPGRFRFGHKSFMEFLFADVWGDFFVENERPDSSAILSACNASASDIAYLPVSVTFLSELIRQNLGAPEHSPENSKSNDKHMARRILQLLLPASFWGYAMGRLRLYDSSLRKLWRFQPRATQILLPLPLFSSSGLATIGVLLANTTLFVGGVDTLTIFEEFFGGVASYMVLLMVMTGSILGAVATRLWDRPGPVDKRLYVWNRICLELGIESRILHQVAGVGWLPGASRRQFDYFIDDDTGLEKPDPGSADSVS